MRPIRHSGYRRSHRSLPCACCNTRRGIEAAHTGPRGLGQKSSDLSCIPLCHEHHNHGNESYHALGPVKFSERWKLEIPALIVGLNLIGLRGLTLHSVGRLERSRAFARLYCACGFRTTWFRLESGAHIALNHHIDSAEGLQRFVASDATADGGELDASIRRAVT
jgi:hypothetical protein